MATSPVDLSDALGGSTAARRLLARFGHEASGAAAVEFGLVAIPFVALIGAIIQFAFIHLWAAQNLDFHLQKAVRGLFTGSFQNANSAITNQTTLLNNLKAAMCQPNGSPAITVFRCSDVKLNVSVASSFAGGSTANPLNGSTKTWNTNFEGYTNAKRGDIVVVTAAVAVPVYFKLLNPSVATLSDGSQMLMSTAVFKTEPF